MTNAPFFLVESGKVQGNGGVNSFSGPAKYKGRTIKVGELVSTLMAGGSEADGFAPEAVALVVRELDFLAGLRGADETYEVVG